MATIEESQRMLLSLAALRRNAPLHKNADVEAGWLTDASDNLGKLKQQVTGLREHLALVLEAAWQTAADHQDDIKIRKEAGDFLDALGPDCDGQEVPTM